MTGRTWVEVDGVTLVAWPDHGCFVEQGADPSTLGALWAPMRTDGTPDLDALAEIEVSYEDA